MTYDISSAAFLTDPAPRLEAMRTEGALVKVKLPIVGTTWMTTTDQAARALLKSPELFARDPMIGTGKTLAQKYWFFPPFMKPLFQNMLGHDGAKHKRLRSLVDQAFARTSVEDMRPRLEAIADGLIKGLPKGTPVDIIAAYTRRLPLLAICDLMGIPQDERDKVARWIAPLSGPVSGLSMIKAFPGLWRIMRYFKADFQRVQNTARPGLICDLVTTELEGDRLSEDELLAMVVTLFIAGHETTVHLITMTLRTILSRPDVRDHWAQSPQGLPQLIEEVMRYCAPVMMTKPHFVQQNTVFEGVSLKKGDQVSALLIAANHDAARFEAPADFRADRRPNPHLGFGHGPHVCLGMQLARAEAQIALTRLFDHFPNIRLAKPNDPPEFIRRIGIHGLKKLKLRLD